MSASVEAVKMYVDIKKNINI